MNAIVCHGSHVFLKHVILIPLNNVSENQYSLRDLKKKKNKLLSYLFQCSTVTAYQALALCINILKCIVHI